MAVVTFTRPDAVVVPTNGVIDSGAHDTLPTGPQARQALAERAQLQRWRAESGPSPGGRVTTGEAIAGAATSRAGEAPANADAAALPGEWLAARERDWPVLVDRGYTAGAASLPAARDAVLMQPQGRDFRRRHGGTIPYAGGWIIFGVSLTLSLFLLIRGRIPLAEGFDGRTVERFSGFERANHWLAASSFVVLGLTGLILVYGWSLLQPLIGSAAYGSVAEAAVYLHIAFAGPFVAGIMVMAVLWLRQNLPSRLDWQWLRRFGGFLSDSPDKPPARRFNAGQKVVFWGVLLGGLLMFLSGVTLMFPFFWTDIHALQWMLLGHALLALLMVGLILGHIYIGTIGMEGAFDAMWSGRVDRNWAKEHHDLWLEELEEGRERDLAATSRPRSQAPAE
jgi:formate dehydrogenase subunit gamma